MARSSKNDVRVRVHTRIRRRVRGTDERPRLAVFRSLNHIYAQVIDDRKGHTLAAASSGEKKSDEKKTEKAEKGKTPTGGNVAGAQQVGTLIAERAKAQGVTRVVFDRGGYLYHGRIKALADAARKAGLEF